MNDANKNFGAGSSQAQISGTQQSDELLLLNERDEKVHAWLTRTTTPGQIQAAIAKLNGKKPYISNICKILKIDPPADIFVTPKIEVHKKVAEIRAILNKGNK